MRTPGTRAGAASASATVATHSASAPSPSAAPATSTAPCPYPSALTTAQSCERPRTLRSRRTFRRTAPRSIVISERCIECPESTFGSASSRSLAIIPAPAEASIAAQWCAVAPAAAARRASMPLARNAAITPVRTSPVPRRREARSHQPSTSTPAPGRGDQRPGALEQDDAAEPVDRAAHGREPVRVDPGGLLADQPAELAGMRSQHARRGPLLGLERQERIAVDDRGQLRLREHPPHERLRPVAAPEPRPNRERAGLLASSRTVPAASSVTSRRRPQPRPLDRL